MTEVPDQGDIIDAMFWSGFNTAEAGGLRKYPYIEGRGLLDEMRREWLRGYDLALLAVSSRLTLHKPIRHAFHVHSRQ